MNQRDLDYLITDYALSSHEAPGIVMTKIESSPVIICGTPAFQDLISGFPGSLDHAPFMLPLPGSSQRTQLDTFFEANKLKIKLVGESKDFSIQKLIAIEGLALMAAPLSSVQSCLDRKELVELGRPGSSRKTCIFSQTSRPRSAH